MSKTLAQIITTYEAHRSAQGAPVTALTPKGTAVSLVYRLRHQLAALEPAERAEIVGLILAELEPAAVTA